MIFIMGLCVGIIIAKERNYTYREKKKKVKKYWLYEDKK